MLRRRRRLAALSQEELADRAVVSVRTVRNIEQGRITKPRPSSVRALADALQLDDAERAEMFALATRSGPMSGTSARAGDSPADDGPASDGPARSRPPETTTAGARPSAAPDAVQLQLRPPVANRTMLVRQRLLDRLRERWSAPVTVVSAPAGYGKTTLLAQAVAANAAAPQGIDCWLACGPDMAAASSLGTALYRALDGPPTTAGAGGRDDVADLAAAVVSAFWRLSPRPVTLFLDDVHEIPAGSDAARLLEAVVASLPANGHVVLAGREAPPVRLARLEVEGRVVRLDQVDLEFTDAELAEFAALRGTPGPKLATCGGWPALAELFVSTRRSTTDDVTGDYIGQEVLSELSPADRRRLGLLAHIGPFDDDLARAVLGSDIDLSDILHGLPLVTLVADGEWCLHALWRALVGRHVTAAEVAEARRRAGVAGLRRGRVGPAIRLLIEAEAWDEFGVAIAETLGVARPPVARDVLADWFARLPPEVRAMPGGRLLAAVAAVDRDPDGARQLLEGCAAEFRTTGQVTGEIACLVQLGQMAWWSEDSEALATLAVRGFELEAAGCEEIVPLACLARALLCDLDSDSRGMLAELDRIRPGSLNGAWWGIVSWLRAIGLLQLGHPPEALDAAEEALALTEFLHAPVAQPTRLQALWFQGRISEVRDSLPGLVEQIKGSGYRNHTALVASQCSVLHAVSGETDMAVACLAQARAEAPLSDAPLVDTNSSLAEAAIAVARGDDATAEAALAAHVARHPVREGLPAAAQQRHLALFYVLVPATRAVWDGADLGPAWAVGRDLARAMVAWRERGEVLATAPLGEPSVVQAHLPLSWVTELALAAIAAGYEDGWRLLDDTWSVTRPTVSELARQAGGTLAQAAREALGRLAVPPTRRLELRLLGPVELWEGGAPIRPPQWEQPPVRSLLTYLAVNRTVGRRQLADDLCPGLDERAQSRRVRATLTDLLRVLEPHRGRRDASFFVRQQGDTVWLHPGGWLTVDLWEFDDRCARASEADREGAPAAALDHALRAVELWRDGPAELSSEPWALLALEQRRLRFAATATRAGELLLAQGNVEGARVLAERAFAVDPGLDAAHRLLAAAAVPRLGEADSRHATPDVQLSRLG